MTETHEAGSSRKQINFEIHVRYMAMVQSKPGERRVCGWRTAFKCAA